MYVVCGEYAAYQNKKMHIKAYADKTAALLEI